MEEMKKENMAPSNLSEADKKDIQDNKAMAALSYIGILVLIPLLAKKDSKFAQFHAKQGLVNFIALIISSIIFVVPFIGWLIGGIAYIVFLVLAIMGIIAAAQGQYKSLPILSKFSHMMNI